MIAWLTSCGTELFQWSRRLPRFHLSSILFLIGIISTYTYYVRSSQFCSLSPWFLSVLRSSSLWSFCVIYVFWCLFLLSFWNLNSDFYLRSIYPIMCCIVNWYGSVGWFLAWKLVLVHVPLVQEIFGLRKKPAKSKPPTRRLSKFYDSLNSQTSASGWWVLFVTLAIR